MIRFERLFAELWCRPTGAGLIERKAMRGVTDRCGNVIAFQARARPGQEQLQQLKVARATARHIEELSGHLQQLRPQPGWSRQRWMIATTPFRMYLTGARNKICELSAPDLGQRPDRWVLELSDACREADRRLHEFDMSLQTLLWPETQTAERIRTTEEFASGRSDLLKVLKEIRCLIALRLAMLPDES